MWSGDGVSSPIVRRIVRFKCTLNLEHSSIRSSVYHCMRCANALGHNTRVWCASASTCVRYANVRSPLQRDARIYTRRYDNLYIAIAIPIYIYIFEFWVCLLSICCALVRVRASASVVVVGAFVVSPCCLWMVAPSTTRVYNTAIVRHYVTRVYVCVRLGAQAPGALPL